MYQLKKRIGNIISTLLKFALFILHFHFTGW